MKVSWYSYILVAAQLAVLAGFVATGSVIAKQPALLVLELLGAGVGVWAVLVMRIGSFNIVPDVKQGVSLVMRGPYRIIRHPMYTSLLVVAAALLADDFSWLRCGLWLLLAAVLLTKLHYEEGLLREAFPGYEEYRKGTYKLIPPLY